MASGLLSTNYNIQFHDGFLTITQALLTVTANDATKVYSAANPDLTGQGVVLNLKNSDDLGIRYTTVAG